MAVADAGADVAVAARTRAEIDEVACVIRGTVELGRGDP